MKLVISDDRSGLKAARQAVLGSVPWQRCRFHLPQNAQAYAPRKDMQSEAAADIRDIFNAPDRSRAEEYLKKAVEKYQKTASKLAFWMENNIPEGLTIFSFTAAHRRKSKFASAIMSSGSGETILMTHAKCVEKICFTCLAIGRSTALKTVINGYP